jgi:hypothetical protein
MCKSVLNFVVKFSCLDKNSEKMLDLFTKNMFAFINTNFKNNRLNFV